MLLQTTMQNLHNFRQLNQIKEYKNNYLLLGHRGDMAYIWTQSNLLWKLIAMGKVSTRTSKPAGPGTDHGNCGLSYPVLFKLTTRSSSLKFSCLKEKWALCCSPGIWWEHKQTNWKPEAATWLSFSEKLRENL